MLSANDANSRLIPIRVGDCIADRYRVVRILGQGGMGIVVEARHCILEQSVALKFLLPSHAQDPGIATRFLREARLASRLRGENVARVMDADRLPSGVPYIVLEYLEGVTVASHLARKGRLSIREAINIVLQAGAGLAEAHSMGIIHRDLKPDNLYLTQGPDRQPLVKVFDFGMSKSLDSDSPDAVTRSNQILGSPHYMSPEQMWTPATVDQRTDIWSLGVILFELLTGSVPFPGRTLLGVFAGSVRPPSMAQFRQDVPLELEHAVGRSLSRKKEDRYGSVAELAAALGASQEDALVSRIARISSPFS